MPEALTPGLTAADKALLQSFGLTEAQKARVWDAWKQAPDGTELVALRARAEGKRGGTSGAGLLLMMLGPPRTGQSWSRSELELRGNGAERAARASSS